MKAIVANLLSGSILGCFLVIRPVLANPQLKKPKKSPMPQILPAKFLAYDKLSIFSGTVNYLGLVFQSQNVRQNQLIFDGRHKQGAVTRSEFESLNAPPPNRIRGSSPYQNPTGDVTWGFQKTFWPSHNSGKYWGLTTVEYWGGSNNNDQREQNSPKSAGINAAPTLPPGNSTLTVSAGGNENLLTKTDSLGEFDGRHKQGAVTRIHLESLNTPPPNRIRGARPYEFRGGVAFHQGLSSDITMGVGFVYEDLLIGFSQFTFKSDRLPLQTTVSLLTGASGLEIDSQLHFKPAKNFVFNYYNQPEQQKFDLNWGLIPGLSLIAQGNSAQESLSTGIEIDIRNHYFSLYAKAKLNNYQNWQWQLNSRLGPVQLIHESNHLQSDSELSYDLWQPKSRGWQFSLGVKYQTQNLEAERENLTIWRGRWNSAQKINDHHLWTFDLGYGYGSQGSGAIASVITTIKPNLKLKLTYQAISLDSHQQNFRLELSSH